MMMMLMSIMTTIIMSSMLMCICMTMSKKSLMDREKMSPFECGFDPKSSPRMPFSIQFFLIATLFLIFDVEIVIILPMIITFKMLTLKTWFIITQAFIIILVIGLYFEWKNSMLEWPL